MSKWHNNSNKPLSSIKWLDIHHNAKIKERESFIKKVFTKNVNSIMDLGCGHGLWLDLIHKNINKNCKLIGVDMNSDSIKLLKQKFESWNRETDYIQCDLENEIEKLPKVDIILIFNILCYFKDPLSLLNQLKNKLNSGGTIIIRQYDGGTMRFGPMDEELRQNFNASIYSSVSNSEQFNHYGMDYIIDIINQSNFENKHIEFETIQKFYPYEKDFELYLRETIEWNIEYSSDLIKNKLNNWYDKNNLKNSYFLEVDLVSILS